MPEFLISESHMLPDPLDLVRKENSALVRPAIAESWKFKVKRAS